ETGVSGGGPVAGARPAPGDPGRSPRTWAAASAVGGATVERPGSARNGTGLSITSRLYPTPLQVLPRASQRMGLDLRVKRDDLLPSPGGGNKVRKLARILAEPEAQPATALVTNGGLQSNHARVVALCAAERGWACELVLHGDPE